MEKIQLIDADTLYHKPIKHPKMLVEGLFSNGLVNRTAEKASPSNDCGQRQNGRPDGYAGYCRREL